jgi:hypothetical protein
MEKKFLFYLLYSVLIDIRERSYEKDDKACYWLSNLLHNVPLVLADGDDVGVDRIYADLLDKIKYDRMEKWLENRKQEFVDRYPEFKDLI